MTLGEMKDKKIREFLGILGYDISEPTKVTFSAAGFIKSYVGPSIETKDDLLLALRLEVDRKTSVGADMQANLRSGLGWGLLCTVIAGGAFYAFGKAKKKGLR